MTLAQARKITAGVGLVSFLCWIWLAFWTFLFSLPLPPIW